MEKLRMILLSGLSLFITSTYCCRLSGSGEFEGPCGSMRGQRLSYGGRMALVKSGGVGFGAPSPPWANQRLFVLRMPPSFFKKRHHHSIFGHKGIIGIISGGAPCGGHIRIQNNCPLTTTQDSVSFCLDPTLPCYKTPPSYAHPEPISFSDITPTSITVTWPAWNETFDVGNGPIVDYKIEMRRGDEADFTKILKGRQLSHQFNNLEEGTPYEFRVTIIRDHPFGEGQPSNPQRCPTSTTGPPQYNNSEPLVFQNVSSSSLTISWPEWDPKVDKGTGPVTGYNILHRKQGNQNWTKKVVHDLSTQLTGLLEHTTYEFSIELEYDNESYSSRTSEQIYTTKCRDIDEIDLQLSSLSNMPGLATISAQWSFNVTSSCVVAQTLTIQQLDSDGGCRPPYPVRSPREIKFDGATRSHTEEGLEAYSQYNVTIAVTTMANGSSYRLVQIRTDSSEPTGQPLSFTYAEISRGRVIFSWKEPECGTRHGEIKEYKYEFRRGTNSRIGRTESTQKRISSLAAGQRYTFRVRAVTEKGAGPKRMLVRCFGLTSCDMM